MGNGMRRLLPVSMIVLVSACSGPGEPFLGTWKLDNQCITIVRNGDEFLMLGMAPLALFGNERREVKVPMTLASTTRLVPAQGGERRGVTYVEASDTIVSVGLLGQSVEYQRAPPGVDYTTCNQEQDA